MPSVAENLLCKGCYHYIYGAEHPAKREAKAPGDPFLKQIRGLEDVYQGTNGEGWKDNQGWNALASLWGEGDPTKGPQAKGICLRKTKSGFYAVTKLDLSNNLLTGSMECDAIFLTTMVLKLAVLCFQATSLLPRAHSHI
jgi:hypothetical protein